MVNAEDALMTIQAPRSSQRCPYDSLLDANEPLQMLVEPIGGE